MKKLLGWLFVIAGVVLVGSGAWYVINNEQREARQKENAQEVLEALAADTSAPINIKDDLPVRRINGLEYIGILKFPAYGIELPVLSTCLEENLDIAPGRLSGTPQSCNLVIGGHNSRAHLGVLQSLQENDEIIFEDFNGVQWKYRVAGSEILYPSQYDELTVSNAPLSLFNCTWDNSQRYVIRALAK